ncbi:MAG: hypothetical protein FJ191_03390 [Gammaproteobacteria bacterium]|nr:hypothetical protein [Gammaproteobacteria bacterium]
MLIRLNELHRQPTTSARKLLREAREVRINLSATLEEALEAAVRQRRRDLWLAENREAIQANNRLIEQEGVFSDELRTF